MENAQPVVTFDPIESWKLGEEGVCTYRVALGTRLSSWDWVGLYKVWDEWAEHSRQ